jgi:hypothetical protein
MQIHRRQWLCPWRCNKKFATKDLLESHLRTNHSTIFTEAQLAHLIDICHRPLEMEEDGDCPLCPVTFPLSTLQPHLAAHLEELALFILPVNTEDRSHDAGSEDMEQISGHAARLDHANSDDELSELEFEDTSSEIVSSQDPEAFKRLVGIVEKPVIQLKDWLLETGKSYATDVYNVPIRDNAGATVDVGDKLVPLPDPVVATDKIKPELQPIHDPDDRASSGCRRTSLDSSSKPTTINAEPRNPKIHGRASRPPSPLYDPYRSSGDGGEIISIPASSGERHSHHRGPYVATMDNAAIHRLSREGGSKGVLGVGSSGEGAKYHRPVYPSTLTRHPDTVADDYGDDGYGYTNPRDLVQYDLSRPARLTPQRRDSYDVSRPSRPRSYDNQEPGPPPTTRGLDKIAARSPLYDTPPIRIARSVPKSQEDSLVKGNTSGPHRTRKERAKGLGVPFNPMNTMDLRALKDELNQKDEKDEKEASVSTIATPQEAVRRGSFERGREPSSLQLEPSTREERGRHDTSSSEEERRPTPRLVSPPREVRKLEENKPRGILRPPREERGRHDTTSSEEERRPTPRLVSPPREVRKLEENKPRGILRPPREKFPEDPVPIREEVASLKDAKRDGIPPDARWTKISRRMVNPEALEAGKERFEAKEDFVIVLRVLTKEEIQAYAVATQQIRGQFSGFTLVMAMDMTNTIRSCA